MNIIQAFEENGALLVQWENGQSSRFSFFWLRDHAMDSKSFDSRSQQREVPSFKLDLDLVADQIKVATDGRSLSLYWQDIQDWSGYSADFLYGFHVPSRCLAQWTPSPWDQSEISRREVVMDWSEFNDQGGQEQLICGLLRDGFVKMEHCPKNFDTVQALADAVGYVRHTIFGGLWEFEANEGMADSAYTPRSLAPHTDGTYSHDAPGVQILACWHYKAEGGSSVLVDGAKIAVRMAVEAPDSYKLLTELDIPCRYAGDGVELIAERPVFRLNSKGELLQVSYNHADRAPFRLEDEKMVQFYQAIRLFHELATDETMLWKHVLQPGELIIFDNWRLLHARDAFRGERKMAGCYLNHEDLESIARKFGHSPGIQLGNF